MKKSKLFIAVAQTASELAIFGAILIFVLGLVVRYAVSFNYIQNQSLEAMRLAFQWSWLSANTEHNAARNMASIVFIEDRKDIDITSGGGVTDGKFGPLTRTPYVVGGSGTFSKNLFMFTDWGYPEDLPILDMFINGKHFSFRTAGFKEYRLCLDDGCTTPNYYRNNDNDPTNDNTGPQYDYRSNCYTQNAVPHGCVILYTRAANPSNKYTKTCNSCFDLDRNLATQCLGCSNGADVPAVPSSARDFFSWQWAPVKATSKYLGVGSFDVSGSLKEQQILTFDRIDSTSTSFSTRNDEVAVLNVGVLDYSQGDLDLTYNDWDAQGGATPASGGPRFPSPVKAGLKDETAIYTYTDTGQGGTYLRVEEGKLYTGGTLTGKQFIRNVQKRDQVDVVERQVQLTNDTGRFCDSAGNPSSTNPAVEACNDCFNQLNGNISKTCFDKSTKILYVRSRIGDTTGKKWITNVSGDKMPIRYP